MVVEMEEKAEGKPTKRLQIFELKELQATEQTLLLDILHLVPTLMDFT